MLRPYGPGKFNTILDSIVYQLTLDGCDEETGSVSETGIWYGLLQGSLKESLNPGESKELNAEELAFLAHKAGAIVSEDDQGFVSVEYYESSEEMESAWSQVLAESAPDEEPEEDGEDGPETGESCDCHDYEPDGDGPEEYD